MPLYSVAVRNCWTEPLAILAYGIEYNTRSASRKTKERVCMQQMLCSVPHSPDTPLRAGYQAMQH